jgi:ribosomal protein S18 acetylase RimI-like enzyme
MNVTDLSPVIRDATEQDLEPIIAIDAQISGIEKRTYWREAYTEYQRHKEIRVFLVATRDNKVMGFIMGEIRAWEFGSKPCGWVFAIGVREDCKLTGVGSRLLDELCRHFRQRGVRKVRTMTAKQDNELLSFFRSQGMMAGPYLQLEKDLSD